jgi:uncharacterized repeat protein (TIGR04076 family)
MSEAYDIVARVISQKGTCGNEHKVGDEVLFTGDSVQGRICLSALYSMLPKVYAMRYGAHFPWLEDQSACSHACPDPENPVVFELRRVKTG